MAEVLKYIGKGQWISIDEKDILPTDKINKKNKNNNQLTTVYWGGVTGNGGAREGGKEGEGRVGNKMTGGRGA